MRDVSSAFHRIAPSLSPDQREQAYWPLLRAEASDNFFWGDAWLYKAEQDLDVAADRLGIRREELRPNQAGPESAVAAAFSAPSSAFTEISELWSPQTEALPASTLVRTGIRHNYRYVYRLIGRDLFSADMRLALADQEYVLVSRNVAPDEGNWRVIIRDAEVCLGGIDSPIFRN